MRYAKLRPFLESAVTWFRKPFALLFVVRAGPCLALVLGKHSGSSGLVGRSLAARPGTLYKASLDRREHPKGHERAT